MNPDDPTLQPDDSAEDRGIEYWQTVGQIEAAEELEQAEREQLPGKSQLPPPPNLDKPKPHHVVESDPF